MAVKNNLGMARCHIKYIASVFNKANEDIGGNGRVANGNKDMEVEIIIWKLEVKLKQFIGIKSEHR